MRLYLGLACALVLAASPIVHADSISSNDPVIIIGRQSTSALQLSVPVERRITMLPFSVPVDMGGGFLTLKMPLGKIGLV